MPSFDSESLVRLGCFGGVLLLMALWELLAPRRRLTVGRPAPGPATWAWWSSTRWPCAS